MNTAKRDEIVKFCEDFLNVDKFDDQCKNGLQVEGSETVSKIITGVTWSEKLVNSAIKNNAEMVLVHHGLFNNLIGTPATITSYTKNRLKQLLRHDISLCGFHLPLDAHATIGNNAIICDLLSISDREMCDVGFTGNLVTPCNIEDFEQLIKEKLNLTATILKNNSKKVSRIGVISGGSSSYFKKAYEQGADSFICGDIKESAVRASEELGVNLIGLGHYNSETFGIKKLGEIVAQKFGVEVEFVDVPNQF